MEWNFLNPDFNGGARKDRITSATSFSDPWCGTVRAASSMFVRLDAHSSGGGLSYIATCFGCRLDWLVLTPKDAGGGSDVCVFQFGADRRQEQVSRTGTSPIISCIFFVSYVRPVELPVVIALLNHVGHTMSAASTLWLHKDVRSKLRSRSMARLRTIMDCRMSVHGCLQTRESGPFRNMFHNPTASLSRMPSPIYHFASAETLQFRRLRPSHCSRARIGVQIHWGHRLRPSALPPSRREPFIFNATRYCACAGAEVTGGS